MSAGTDGSHRASPPSTGSTGAEEHRSLGELMSAVTNDVSTLVRQEIALAKAEAKESAAHAGKGAGMLGGAEQAEDCRAPGPGQRSPPLVPGEVAHGAEGRGQREDQIVIHRRRRSGRRP